MTRLYNYLGEFKEWILIGFTSLAIYFEPVIPLIFTTIFFLCFDTIFAIFTTIKLKGTKSLKSHKFQNFFYKAFMYIGVILLFHTLETNILGINWTSHLPILSFPFPYFLTKGFAFLICVNEIKSIDETWVKLGNRSFWVILKDVLIKGKSLKKDLNEITDFDKDEENI